MRVLDLATGTGDLARALYKGVPEVEVVGADPSEGMLAIARDKVPDVSFVRASAEELPFAAEEFDVVTAAFGVRNFSDIPRGLTEMHRVLRRGGCVVILEFSTPRSRVFGALYGFYFHKVLPRVGALLSRDGRAYAYLPSSVAEFPAPPEFTAMLGAAGFTDVIARPLTGGVAYIYKGVK